VKRVYLFYLSDVKYGGWPTFTCHLALALRSFGLEPTLVRIGKKTSSKARSFGRGLSFFYASLNAAVAWAGRGPSIVVVASPKMSLEAFALVDAGAHLVVHDPTELKGGSLDETIKASRHPVIVIRRTMIPVIDRCGGTATYLPHPYVSAGVGAGVDLPVSRSYHAVSVSRVDFDKNTDMLARANMQLSPDKRIEIYGAVNRLYAFHKLDKDVPQWRDHYRGTFNGDSLWAGSLIAREGRYAVDMSTISGDGGGTQYTHLEAWDAGARLVLHNKWLTGDPLQDEVAQAAICVTNADDLASVLETDADGVSQGNIARQLLHAHAPATLRPQLLETLGVTV
jgi:hypothetical protein